MTKFASHEFVKWKYVGRRCKNNTRKCLKAAPISHNSILKIRQPINFVPFCHFWLLINVKIGSFVILNGFGNKYALTLCRLKINFKNKKIKTL